MIRMQRLFFPGLLGRIPGFLLITIAAAVAQSVDFRVGSGPHSGGVDVTDIGPEGGNFLSLAVDGGNPGVLYAGALNTGVFKTTDGGLSWIKAGLAGLAVVSLAVDPNTSDSVFAAAASDAGDGELTNTELFRSLDGGATWTRYLPAFRRIALRLL